MKRFKELTDQQREEAIQFALDEFKALIEEGVVAGMSSDDPALLEYATIAAEESFYAESQDRVIYSVLG